MRAREPPRWGRGRPRAGGALTLPPPNPSDPPRPPPLPRFGPSCLGRTFASGAAASRIYKARGRCPSARPPTRGGFAADPPAAGFALSGDSNPMGGGVRRPAMVVSPGSLLRLAG